MMTRTIALPVLLTLGTAACFTWRPYEPAAPLAESPDLPQRVRVFSGDSAPIPLNSPYVRRDSLFGRTDGRDTVGFAVATVKALEASRFHLWRTLGATIVAPAAALLVTYAIVCNGDKCDPQTVH
jgi:hypothetical protein